MYRQIYDPIGGSLFLSSLLAALPLLTMFLLLGWLRVAPHKAALASLVVCMAVAVVGYGMRLATTLNVGAYGAAFSFLTVLWIIVNAIWLYNLTLKSGHFAVLKDSFARISPDPRIQAIIIAYNFGALMEALAGAGTPIAISGAMLLAMGIKPMKAAVLALVANTAPVAFGALAVPIVTLAQVSGQPFDELGAIVGRQTPVLAAFVPLVLVFILDGRRGLRQMWPGALVAGFAFAAAQWVAANHVSIELADVFGSLGSAGALILFLKAWQPAEATDIADVEKPTSAPAVHDARSVWTAYAPYILIILVFSLAQMKSVQALLSIGTFKFAWPGLAITNAGGKPVGSVLNLNLLSATGTLLLAAGIVSSFLLGLKPSTTLATYGSTVKQLRWAIPTVLCVLALAFVMNYSGETITLGRWMAQTGSAFALLSPVIGWVGVAVTGSDNSSNALFGALQVAAGHETGIRPSLLAAANASGGVLGKMISPQSLAVGAAAVGCIGQEGLIFRKVLGWSIIMLALLSLIVWLQAGPLAFLLP